MDRDAGSPFPLTPADADPPYAPGTVRLTGWVGVGAIATAAILGLVSLALGESTPSILTAARLFLVFVGVVSAGAAVSMRPDLWWSWGIGTIASLLGVWGLPNSWDSFQLFLSVVAGVAAAGAVFCLLSPGWRYGIASAILLFHFAGIFIATTEPPSTPWLSDQLFRRVYNPYLQFVYLRNAYHFYSPEPGPASVLAFLLKTETDEIDPETHKNRYTTKWVVLPTRPADIRDPLGLGYYRLLALNEQLARGNHLLAMPANQFETSEMSLRRHRVQHIIPFHPAEPSVVQYKLPSPEVARYLLPSYASHVILWNTPDKATAAKTTVKMYRMEHRDLPPDQFSKGHSPYHPGTYRPFFLGEFNAFGHLMNPQEELLYWMLPVLPRQPGLDNRKDPFKKDYLDYLSVHALELSPEEVLAANENDGRVFNWSQLR